MSASGDIALIRDCAYELAELAMNEGAASKKDVAFECDQIAAALARLEQRETKLSKSLLLAYLHDVYKPEGVDIWLAQARRDKLTLDEQLTKAEQLVTGAFRMTPDAGDPGGVRQKPDVAEQEHLASLADSLTRERDDARAQEAGLRKHLDVQYDACNRSEAQVAVYRQALDEAATQLEGLKREEREYVRVIAAIAICRSALEETACFGHPAGPGDPMGETVYCDGSCRVVSPATTDTTLEAAAIVARHKLPGGKYGIGTPSGRVTYVGSAFDAVAAALATGEDSRLYRQAFGWRFVGVVKPDGTFVDERRPSNG